MTTAGSSTHDVRLPAALATTATGDTTAAWVVRDGSVAGDPIYRLQAARAESGDFGTPALIDSQPDANFGGEIPGIVGQTLALDSQARAVLIFCASSTR